MLESILIGLLTSGIYYLADRHKDGLSEQQSNFAASTDSIHNSIESGLKSAFPRLLRDFPEITGITSKQTESLRHLFFDSSDELEDELRRTVLESLYGPSASAYTTEQPRVDMFSVNGFERVVKDLIRKKGASSLDPQIVSFAVPRLFLGMLREVSRNDGLNEAFTLIRLCQEDRFRREVVDRLVDIRRYIQPERGAAVAAINAVRGRRPHANSTLRWPAKSPA